jgi:hypothetical protein
MAVGAAPTTRLSVTDVLPGCLNVTASPAPTPKLCQLMTAFWLDWLIVTVLPLFAILADPDETAPPSGNA